jgi:hypothetical protein
MWWELLKEGKYRCSRWEFKKLTEKLFKFLCPIFEKAQVVEINKDATFASLTRKTDIWQIRDVRVLLRYGACLNCITSVYVEKIT